MQVKVKARQTPVDLAIQCAGTLESLFDLAAINDLEGITARLQPGQSLTAPDIVVFEVADYFRKYNIYPASDTTPLSALLDQGVEFWSIEYDFKIS